MLRWIFLLLLLGNALLFFWYAQSYRFADDGSRADFKPTLLRTPEELGAGEALEPRPRVCGYYQPLAGEFEASQLVDLLERYGIQANMAQMPPIAKGVRLELPLPADANARIAVLDDLARAGWVPESRDGALVLGEYASEEALKTTLSSLPENIASRIRTKQVIEPSREYRVDLSYLEGYEISSEINQLITGSWPGIKFEKNACIGVASLGSDQ